MKNTIKLLAVIALFGGAVTASAQEYKSHEVANAPAFNSIEVSGGDVNVYFSQGEKHSFSINGPVKAVKATKIKVKNNTLIIDYNEPFFMGDDNDLSVYVTAPNINRIVVSGEADFESKTAFQGKDLTIKTLKNGEVSMKYLSVGQINIDAKSTSSVDLDYVEANLINVASQDRAEVELSGSTDQMKVLKKGMLAEIDTEKLIIKNTGNSGANAEQKVAQDGSVEFVF